MNKKGTILIIVLLVVVVLSLLGSAIISRSVSENRLAQINLESNQAFWLAEAGVSRAMNALRSNYDTTGPDYANVGPSGSQIGGCSFTSSVSGANRIITAIGCVPASCNCDPTSCHAIRAIQALMNQYQVIPVGFYDNAIYSAGSVGIGSNCPVDGNVFSGAPVTGSVESPHAITQNDPTLQEEGLPALSFSELRQKSIDQGWYNPSTKVT
ncbi:MAG: PilX N-terminal domain-containing pilus assembly protein, partial [Candidatus Omnitrophota bacterium]